MTAPFATEAESRFRAWESAGRARRALWRCAGAIGFGLVPEPFPAVRNWVLRRFGARVGPGTTISRSVRITDPWNLRIGAGSEVHFGATLDCMGSIEIGDRVRISQYANLCAGTHDLSSPGLPIVAAPIRIGNDVWIAADAFVGPNAVIGAGSVVAARSSAFGTLPEGMVCVGEPARPVKPRGRGPVHR
jgi:putative colanic acid biosynthesis acetyltransferase WcaF